MSDKNRPELTLRGLRAFIAVEETGSISAGAARMRGSSSGISQQITALEQSIGAPLFDRQSRPLRLTPAGQMLRANAHMIINNVDDIQSKLLQNNLVDLPKLNLAIIDDLDTSLTPILVAKLQRRFRNCFVNAYSGHSDMIVEQLQSRQADIGISALAPENVRNFRSIPILHEQFILVAARGLLDAHAEMKEQLLKIPFIQYSESIPIGRKIAQHLKRSRFNVPDKYALESSRSVIAMVGQTKGWTLTTPLNLLDAERFISLLDIFPIPFPAFTRSIYLIARMSDLGELPDNLARECRKLIQDQVISRFAERVPSMPDSIRIIQE